jgi:hypothetical protein
MSPNDASVLRDRLDEFVGRPMSGTGPSTAPDPVNLPMIRHWAAAFEDADPVYTDPEAARASRFGQIVAPPLMLQTWTMPTPIITGIGERGGAPRESVGESALTVLDAAGYTGTLASNSEFELERPVHLGEVISSQNVLESVSPEKQTRLGSGFFVTWVTTYTSDTGDVVGRQRFRVLKFRPPRGDA